MDFSPWDWATHFRLHEAACLIAGVMPVSKREPTSDELPPQVRPILIKLGSAYYEWYFQVRNPERPKAMSLKGVLNPDGTLPEFPVSTALAGEIVSRAAIRDFISEMGRKSAYDFNPIEEKKPFTPVETQIFLPEQANTQPQATPVVAVSASGGVEPAKDGPLPLTTGDIAFCFAGLRWDEQQWKKSLGNKPKWLAVCIAIPGARGVSETRWNPVLIGAALEREGHAKQNSIRARFQTQPQLAPWLDVWKTYEADNLSTD